MQTDFPSIEQGLCQNDPNDPCCPGSPIILDLNGDGFNLTDRARGVPFDLRATGRLSTFAWTAPGSDDAWLVLDRNGNGVIDDGTEMFGNFTEQPSSAARNGFIALAMFDDPRADGNNDRKIDINDSVFTRLRLWQDRNHDGVSEASELLTLPEGGIRAMSLDYSMVNTTDQYGNNFRYVAEVQGEDGAPVGPLMYDVFLTARSAKSASVDGTSSRIVWRWRCGSTCKQEALPPWDANVYCQPPDMSVTGPFMVTQEDACLGAQLACVNALLKDTNHCTLGSPITCTGCYRTTVTIDDPPPGCG